MQKHATTIRYYSVNRGDIAYLRFIIESYEGLATLSTVDAKMGIVSLSVPGCFLEDADRLMEALKSEIAITECGFPRESPEPRECREEQERNRHA